MDPFAHRVRSVLRALDPPPGPWLVGVSGGADSTALACALRAARPDHALTLAHLDHGWRSPAEANADRDAAQALADALGLPLVCGRCEPTPGETGSLEAGARDARHAWLCEQALSLGATAILLGHTQDDQVETVLWRVLRGAQLSGLAGIPQRRRLAAGPQLVRPLLAEPRAEVEAYLARRGVSWREDPSNADPRFLRARLRRDVLPVLRELNPQLAGSLTRLAASAGGVEAWLAGEVAALRAAGLELGGPTLELAAWRELPPPVQERLLHDWLRPRVGARLLSVHVHAAVRVAGQGGTAELPGGLRLSRVDDHLLLAEGSLEPALPPAPAALPCPGERTLAEWGLRIRLRVHDAPPPTWRDAPPQVAYLDRAVVKGPLGLRGRRSGDRFWPLGAPGTRTLKRFYIDRRIPQSARDGLPVVTDDDRPMWVVGHRIDQRYRVTSATRSVLEIRTETSAGETEEG